jgi:hypothetical protein
MRKLREIGHAGSLVLFRICQSIDAQLLQANSSELKRQKGRCVLFFLGREKPYSKSTADLARDDQLFLQLLRRISRRSTYCRDLGRPPSLDGNRQFRHGHTSHGTYPSGCGDSLPTCFS